MASFTSTPKTATPFTDINPATGTQGAYPQAVVNIVDSINIDTDDSARFRDVTSVSTAAFFTDYKVHGHYENDKHIYMMGVTSPSGYKGMSAAFVQLAQPTTLWIADWTACKTGEQPEIPDPDLLVGFRTPGAGNLLGKWVLMDDHLEPAEIVVGPDGVTPLYRLSGTYVYGCTSASEVPSDDVTFPLVPWLQNNFPAGRGIPQSKLAGNIINDA